MDSDKKILILWSLFLLFFLGLFLITGMYRPEQPKREVRIIILKKDYKSLLDIDRDDWQSIVAEDVP